MIITNYVVLGNSKYDKDSGDDSDVSFTPEFFEQIAKEQNLDDGDDNPDEIE